MTKEQLKEFTKRMTEVSGLSEEQLAEKINNAVEGESRPSIPSNLDEAAEKCACIEYPPYYEMPDDNWKERAGYVKGFKAGAELMAGQGVSMQITDDTEWEEVDSFIHKNVDGCSIIQIRKK